jgi:hypothetical protein
VSDGWAFEIERRDVGARVSRLHALTSAAAASLQASGVDGDGSLDTVERLSDELKATAIALGLDSQVARRLLSVRELLDSHLLTATAIASCDLDETAAIAMVRRGIDAVAAGLPHQGDPLLAGAEMQPAYPRIKPAIAP